MSSSNSTFAWVLLATLCVGCGSSSDGAGPNGLDSNGEQGDSGFHGVRSDSGITLDEAGLNKSGACVRTVNLTDVQVDRPQPYDVVIVADHSDSLSWSRENLSNGLRELLRNVRGSQARFYLLTPTQYGPSSEEAKSRANGAYLVDWEDPVTREGYPHAVTGYVQTCATSRGGPAIPCPELWGGSDPYALHGEWQFQRPKALAEITPDMSDAQLAAEQARVAQAIQALGGGGADREQPLCTLHRYLAQERAALPQNVVFLVLSDENDTSTPAQCLAAYDYVRGPATTPVCTENCTKFRYEMNKPDIGSEIDALCVPLDDTGTPRLDQAYRRSATSFSGVCPPGSECSAEDLETALWACGDKHVVQDCKRSCATGGAWSICQVDRASAAVNLCTSSFSEHGQTYANLDDYCTKTYAKSGWQECKMSEVTEGSVIGAGEEVITKVVPGTQTSDLIDAFKTKATAVFGAKGYVVSSVILDPAFDCSVKAGQSYGTNLRAIASSPANVHSLCGDYADALQRVESFARQLLNTDYAIKLKNTEKINTVRVIERTGTERQLEPADWTYIEDGGRLKIASGVLGPKDAKLAVDVEDTCKVILR